jgi:hypothetical protein
MIAGKPKVGRPVVVCATIAVLVVILVFVFLFMFKPTPPSKKPPLHPALLVMREQSRAVDETTAAYHARLLGWVRGASGRGACVNFVK